MLYTFPLLKNHKVYRLNRNLIYFFAKLRHIGNGSSFVPVSEYFDSEFSNFLITNQQETLFNHFNDFFDCFKSLNPTKRAIIIDRFFQSQKVSLILGDLNFDGNSIKLSSLPTEIQPFAKNLFSYLYANTLKSFGKLKDHYTQIFEDLNSTICPFCGIENLNSPKVFRQDYDHMLLISEYVFCGINMDNLVPTGIECNRINKHNIDVLYNANVRTVFNSAYIAKYDIRISLSGSNPPSTPNDTGNWTFTFTPSNQYVTEWCRVYKIQTRFSETILRKFYKHWLKFLKEYLGLKSRIPISQQDLHQELTTQAENLRNNPLADPNNIIKGALFDFVANHIDNGYQNAILDYFNN